MLLFFLITFFSNLILSLNQGESHRIHPLPHGKRGKLEKNMAMGGLDFKSLLSGGLNSQRDRGELNSQTGLDFPLLATMFFCKHVISEAALLLIIHVFKYILIFLI